MQKILTIFLTALLVYAQYKPNDKELIRTTFLREFDMRIIESYLDSGDEEKINAALLSIAQSGDETFIEQILELNFEQSGKYISFALGKLGENKNSADFLLSQAKENDYEFSDEIFEALSKTGSLSHLKELTDLEKQKRSNHFPLAVYNFHLRGIIDSTENDVQILLDNLSILSNDELLFNSLFALYRIAPDKVEPEKLFPILEGEFDASIKTYALGILRKNSTFHFGIELVKKLANDERWSVRTEAARTICYYPFETQEQLRVFTKLLSDTNPSTARTAAQSITNLNITSDTLKQNLIEKLRFIIVDDDYTDNVRGEILLALQQWQPEKSREFYLEYKCMVSPFYIYQLLGNIADEATGFAILKELYEKSNSYEKFHIYSNIGNFYDSLKTNAAFTNFLIEQYSSGLPLIITLNNYLIDSTTAVNNRELLKDKIDSLIDEQIENTEFNQAISTISNVTNLIDSAFTNSLYEKIAASNNYSLQYDLRNEIPLSAAALAKRQELFDELFDNSFSFSKAIIKSVKGNYTIEFIPEVAPISVGNFIMLAKRNFYNNILYHRVVPNFVIQTGDPTGTGWSGPDHTIVSEFSPQPFETYYVGMASAGKDTEGSQWFVMNNHYPHLDGNYTNFGKVTFGFETVDLTDQFDMVYYIELVR